MVCTIPQKIAYTLFQILWREMKQNEKASLMRVISDLIQADGIIDMQEIEYLETLRTKYKIMPDDERRADHLTFAEAVTTLAEAEAVLRHQLVTDFAEVAMSDNYCARAEALLMLALRYCLVVANGGSASIISVSNAEVQFDDNQLLYVESQYDTCINTQIESHFNELSNMVRLAGFDFVYIPRVSAHYGSISEDDMKRVVRFLYPSVSIERLQLVWGSLQSLKTHEYCRDLLSAKLGLREMAFVAPSVMIKVGDSVVGGESFSNFLLVEVGKNVLLSVEQLLAVYAKLFHNLHLNYLHEEPGRFVYKGFYRQVFDLHMLRRGIKSRIVVDTVRGCISLPDADTVIDVHRREKALYALFLLESVREGINFTKPDSACGLKSYNCRMDHVMQKYRKIYAKFGGDPVKAPNICDYSTRGPMIAMLKKKILSLDDVLHHASSYCVERNSYGNYTIDITPDMICCIDSNFQLCPLWENDEWRAIAAL